MAAKLSAVSTKRKEGPTSKREHSQPMNKKARVEAKPSSQQASKVPEHDLDDFSDSEDGGVKLEKQPRTPKKGKMAKPKGEGYNRNST